MTDLFAQPFAVTFTVTIHVQEIDDALIAETKARWNNPSLADDPDVVEQIARDQRLQAALLRHPGTLRHLLLRHVAWELDDIRSARQILEDNHDTETSAETFSATLLEEIQDDLPPTDREFLRDVIADGYFYDSTSFFQDAITAEVSSVAIVPTSSTFAPRLSSDA